MQFMALAAPAERLSVVPGQGAWGVTLAAWRGGDGALPLIPCCKTLNVNFTFHLFFFLIKTEVLFR